MTKRLYVLATSFFLVVFASPVYAQSGPAKITDILHLLENILKLLAPAAGIAFFIMLLIGGYKFITSGGDPKNVSAARSPLTYAVIGIVLVVASWLILNLIKSFTGVDVTTVTFPDEKTP